MEHDAFDLTLATECAAAFCEATGLGCMVSNGRGKVFAQAGYSCACCGLCAIAGVPKSQCLRAQNYSAHEAERFGGKYIYCCPMGLTCFVSPIFDDLQSAVRITAGPFLMVERDDYIDCELNAVSPPLRTRMLQELARIPVVLAPRVNRMATLLFMAVGFMNKVSVSNRLLQTQSCDAVQRQVSDYIRQLKQEDVPVSYPFSTEKVFLRSLQRGEKHEAQQLLNELLGHILFAYGKDLIRIQSRALELMTLAGRAAIDGGADATTTLAFCHETRRRMEEAHGAEEICAIVNAAMDHISDDVCRYADMRHTHAVHLCIQYIESHCEEKITLEQLARMTHLSTAYLSRMFKQSAGTTLRTYLNGVRIARARRLLAQESMRVIDVANAVGFDDQSYFTKVFRRVTGMTPLAYRAQIAKQKNIFS